MCTIHASQGESHNHYDLKVPALRHTTIASSCYWLYDYGDALQGGLVLKVGTLGWALFFHVQYIFLSYMGSCPAGDPRGKLSE